MPNWAVRSWRSLLLGAVVVSSGCGSAGRLSSACSPKAISVAKARTEQHTFLVLVKGHYLRRNGTALICDALVGSASRRCANPGLALRGYEPPSRVKVQHAGGVAWTRGTVQIYGRVSGTTLRAAGCS